MIDDSLDFGFISTKDFDPNTFFKQVKEQSGRGVARTATQAMILNVSSLCEYKSYKELQEMWTERD